ncbi:MAG TPA: hypothetical protein PK306_18360 [Aquabacterium sp.]|nr:hypothetical protein [Aquabacterium sp.]
MLNVFAHHPEIYRALSRWLPLARRSGTCAESKGWGIYILVAVLSQVQPWAREPSALADAAWMLATLSTLFAVVAVLRELPRWIGDALKQVRFSSILVILLWPDQGIRTIPKPLSSSRIARYPDPDRPLKLRI